MSDIIQSSECVDDMRAQHWVNILNKKFTVTKSVCRRSFYTANDNFVVGVDIRTRRSNIVSSCFTRNRNIDISEEKGSCSWRELARELVSMMKNVTVIRLTWIKV